MACQELIKAFEIAWMIQITEAKAAKLARQDVNRVGKRQWGKCNAKKRVSYFLSRERV
jgi:hypothetical protein